MSLLVRRAKASDASRIRTLGLSDGAFSVSEAIPFYEEQELVEWSNNPEPNLLFVAEEKDCLVGFFFCKIISCHWAMLDNFYVMPNERRRGISRALMETLTIELERQSIAYLTTLVLVENEELASLLPEHGFRKTKRYDWYEYFLDSPA